MTSETSALFALSELQALEADRVRAEQQAREAAAAAERLAREQAAQRERELAEQRAAEEAARLRAQREAELERERQEQLRLREAEAIARAEHEARLRREQLHLEAQIRLAERKAKPKWPLAVVPVLLLGLVGAGAMLWHGEREAEREAALHAAEAQARADDFAAMSEKLDRLTAEQAQLQQDRALLLQQIAAAKNDEAAATALKEKLDALDAKIASNDDAQRKAGGDGKGRGTKPRATRKPPRETKTETSPKPKGRTDGRVKVDTTDPLAGLLND
ncbi:MAG: hypothetical protein KC501_09085 [Myxococcales bacterium]|nr:hypothetical protein [Myxococcales bacterium]